MYESMVGHRGGNLYRCMDLPFDTVLICGNKQLVVIIRNKYRAGEDILIPMEDYNQACSWCRGRYSAEGAFVFEQGVN